MRHRWTRAAALALLMAVAGAGCSAADAPPTETRGRAIDQDTGEGIADAIVVAQYMGGISWGGGSCNRVESAVSDADGWFLMPTDPKAGPTLIEAYHRDYVHGNPTRHAFLDDVSKGEWRVQIQKWDVDNRESRIIGYDPRVFRSEKEALDGSGEWRDAYMRRFHGSRDARLRELQRISITCAGGPQTTAGLVPFLEAVLKEQEELGDSSDSLRDTRQALVWAKEQGSPNAPKRR